MWDSRYVWIYWVYVGTQLSDPTKHELSSTHSSSSHPSLSLWVLFRIEMVGWLSPCPAQRLPMSLSQMLLEEEQQRIRGTLESLSTFLTGRGISRP